MHLLFSRFHKVFAWTRRGHMTDSVKKIPQKNKRIIENEVTLRRSLTKSSPSLICSRSELLSEIFLLTFCNHYIVTLFETKNTSLKYIRYDIGTNIRYTDKKIFAVPCNRTLLVLIVKKRICLKPYIICYCSPSLLLFCEFTINLNFSHPIAH